MNPLQTFASGDTNYISKHNSNYATIAATIAGLEAGIAAAGNSETNWTAWLAGMYGAGPTLIGSDSYKTTGSGTSVSVAAGSVWLGDIQKIVSSTGSVSLTLSGAAGTYYVVPNGAGVPAISSSSTNAVYSVVWTGSAVSTITRVADVAQNFEDTALLYNAVVRKDVHLYFSGVPTASQVIVGHVFPRQCDFPVGWTGSFAKAKVAATATAAFDIRKTGSGSSVIGTVTWNAGQTTGVLALSVAATFIAGDILEIVAPASPDATLSDLAFVLVGTESI